MLNLEKEILRDEFARLRAEWDRLTAEINPLLEAREQVQLQLDTLKPGLKNLQAILGHGPKT